MPKNMIVSDDSKYEVVDNSNMYEKELRDLTKTKAHIVTNVVEDYAVTALATLCHWGFNQLQLAIEEIFSA